MGIDWENMLGTSGNGLNDAYDSAVSAVIYSEDPGDGHRPLPVDEAHDDTDGDCAERGGRRGGGWEKKGMAGPESFRCVPFP
ncbi:hypothetical protein JK364_23395 [Streptomyces sp. 110]|uniref:Uncharacterized protein n=1 Tax=Streptomyces endocoffeicus TaxID=2898945 RepID=A0ABS1PSQ6_9ACTN|nr:hypothetical protein [Streptomyces endocoffeicus]MBL1115319.1 hypothetical protein [Streptomyces endocoffeicus]